MPLLTDDPHARSQEHRRRLHPVHWSAGLTILLSLTFCGRGLIPDPAVGSDLVSADLDADGQPLVRHFHVVPEQSSEVISNLSSLTLQDVPAEALVIVGSIDLDANLHPIELYAEETVGTIQPCLPQSGVAPMSVQRSDLDQPVLIISSPDCGDARHNLRTSPETWQPGWSRPSSPGNRPAATWISPPAEVVAASQPTGPAETPKFARQFLAPRFLDEGTTQSLCEGILLQHTQRIAVYCDAALRRRAGDDKTAELLARRIVEEMGGVLSGVEAILGPVEDPDRSGRLTILLTQLDQRLRQEDAPIHGCVRAADFLASDHPFGGDILYLDVRAPQNSELAAILAHETAHAATYSAGLRYSARSGGLSMEEVCERIPVWLNEAIAHAVERRMAPGSQNFQLRMAAFLNDPEQAAIMFPAVSTSARLTRGGSRAAATLFLEAATRHSHNLKWMLDLDLTPVKRIETVSELPFAELFRMWTIQHALTARATQRHVADMSEPGGDHGRLVRGAHRVRVLRAGHWQQWKQQGTTAAYLMTAGPLSTLTIRGPANARLQFSILLPESHVPADREPAGRSGATTAQSGRSGDRTPGEFTGQPPIRLPRISI